MTDEVFNILKKKGDKYGIPVSIWYPIVMTESGGNPLAIGDSGKSYGLFQVYTTVHPDYNIEKGKTSISYQADYWMPNLAKAYQQGLQKGLTGLDLTLYTERYGEKPKWTTTVINNITKYYNDLSNIIKEFLLPVTGTITSLFGYRSDPITGEKDFHKGIDIAAPVGTSVTSVLGGKVVNIGYDSSYGNFVEVQSQSGISEFFAHLSKITVSKGQNISIGGTIGNVGSTGRSTGYHLHYEIRKNGEAINPIDFLKNSVGSIYKHIGDSLDSLNSFFNDLPVILGNVGLSVGIYWFLTLVMIISLFFMFLETEKIKEGIKFGIDFIPGGNIIKEAI
jgi:murein DD-endopeptidase MepM/ murein hydrolase activator NlpD